MGRLFAILMVLTLIMCQTEDSEDMGMSINDVSQSSSDTIFVSYRSYLGDHPITEYCKDYVEWASETKIYKTIKIGKKDYDDIYLLIKGPHKRVKGPIVNEDMVCEPEILLQVEDACIALGYSFRDWFFLCDSDSHYLADVIPELSYKIRCISGYYDCLMSIDLLYDPLIEKYGLPLGYSFIKSNSSMDKKFEMSIEEDFSFRKVALVCRE